MARFDPNVSVHPVKFGELDMTFDERGSTYLAMRMIQWVKENEDPDAVISSKDLHESMNRERKARGETSIPSINNVQGASSSNLARRDHTWSSVPDFFIKLFRRK